MKKVQLTEAEINATIDVIIDYTYRLRKKIELEELNNSHRNWPFYKKRLKLLDSVQLILERTRKD